MKLAHTIVISTVLAFGALGVATGCSLPDDVDSSTEPLQTGTLNVALTGNANGITYRLRNALFEISGPASGTLDSEIDPDAPELVLALPVGQYQVFLRTGWALERVDAGGAVPVQAVLISPNPAVADVIGGSRANTLFRFQTDDTIVDIGQGELAISIAVDVVGGGGGGVCDATNPASCPPPDACYLTGAGEMCLPAGSAPPGAACTAPNECSPGFTCADLGTGPVCTEVCTLGGLCSEGSVCQDVGLGAVGVCDGTGGGGGGGGACDYADPATCPAGEDCYPVDSAGTRTCAPTGSALPGAPCSGTLNDCVENYLCLDDGTGPRCYASCLLAAPTTCTASQTCAELGVPDIGACYP
jgi:hypothetical protein